MSHPPDRTIRALIVAFDDVLVATRAVRAAALHEACLAEGLDLAPERIAPMVADRSLEELQMAGWPATPEDPARATLVALRARDLLAQRLAQGAPFDALIVQRLTAAASAGCRVVVRADAPRGVVTRALETTPLYDAIGMLVCADDAGAGSPSQSWALIDQRLGRVGMPSPVRLAVECRPDAVQIAARYAAFVEPWNSPPPPSYSPA